MSVQTTVEPTVHHAFTALTVRVLVRLNIDVCKNDVLLFRFDVNHVKNNAEEDEMTVFLVGYETLICFFAVK